MSHSPRLRPSDLLVLLSSLLLFLSCPTASLAGFGTVIDIPPEPDIGDNGSIGSSTQLNLFAGGSIGESFDAGAVDGSSIDVEVNVEGGTVGNEFQANGGSEVNVRSGIVGDQFQANGGSHVIVSGGSVGNEFQANDNSIVDIPGGNVGSLMQIFDSDVHVSGGIVGNDVDVYSDGHLLVSDGRVGFFVDAGLEDGSSSNVLVEMTGGIVGPAIKMYAGSEWISTGGLIPKVSTFGIVFCDASTGFVHGGTVDGDFDTETGANVNIYGSDFELDGEPLNVVGSLEVNVSGESILTGILSDGTPFALGEPLEDSIAADTLTLHAAAVAPLGPATINVPADPSPRSVREGQTLTVGVGGQIGGVFRGGPGSTINVNGGSIGSGMEVYRATVNITDGSVGGELRALGGSEVNISGGTVGGFFDAFGGVVNISGGSIGTGFRALPDSVVNISGGQMGFFFRIAADAQVTASGGTYNDNLSADAGSTLHLQGGEFRIDGDPVDDVNNAGGGVEINLPPTSVLSGVFADGTPFAFANQDGDRLDGTLTLEAVELPPIGPAVINVPADDIPLGLRDGQTLTLDEGGTIGDFRGANFVAGEGSAVVIQGGTINSNFEAVAATVDISGGFVGSGFDAFYGSVVTITGGSVTEGFQAHSGSTVNVSGGSVGREGAFLPSLEALGGSVVNISGGTVGDRVSALEGSEFNISGGSLGTLFFGAGGSIVNVTGGSFEGQVSISSTEFNLSGSNFQLDGVAIPDLELGDPRAIPERGVTLTGILADGTPFSFDLNDVFLFGEDFFNAVAGVTVTLVDALLAGDYNGDGTVNAPDYNVWRDTFGSTVELAGDGNGNGVIDAADYNVWRDNFGTGVAAVPEPTNLVMLMMAMSVAFLHRKR